MPNLITKYNISETDLYTLGLVESKKKSSGYSKREKLKSVSLKILKPYKVKFMDLGVLLNEIKKGGFDNKYSESVSKEKKLEIEKMIQEIVEKSNTKFYKDFWSERSKIQKLGIIMVIPIMFAIGNSIGGVSNGSICDCKENYWDPNDKKYGNTMSLEDTGNLGGMNLTKRSNMYNHFNGMVSFKDLSDSDKKLRKKCLKKYLSETEVMMSNCN
jgi:hypothetical protein